MKLVIMQFIDADVLVIGGGTAGCLAAFRAREASSDCKVVVLEKAHVERSGCLAGGLNAINAFLHEGETPASFVKYVRYDARGLVREDLVLSIAEKLNKQVELLEKWGVPIQKDEFGKYAKRGRWNVKIHGESLKPLLAQKAMDSGAQIFNHVACTNLAKIGERVVGAFGFGVKDGKFYAVRAKSTIIATGGCSGLYRPNNPGGAKNKTWYSPFNTGAGFAMGLRSGAEMTSFEMRFIALRTKDVICPTGTLALGFGAKQVNSSGLEYLSEKYAKLGGEKAPSCIRVFAPTLENKEGRGPCYLDTTHLSAEQVLKLKEAYLDMYPNIVLYWASNNFDPSLEKVEVTGTEPYVVGGHCQSGFWVSSNRSTTLKGLFAAGDVAGGASYKFVSGVMAEGQIASEGAVKFALQQEFAPEEEFQKLAEEEKTRVFKPLENNQVENTVFPSQFEERIQKVLDEYAGGISAFYELNGEKLVVARKKLESAVSQQKFLAAKNLHDLELAHSVIDRLLVARVLVEHLLYRKETRWKGFQTRADFPEKDDSRWSVFVNSILEKNVVKIIERPYEQIVSGDRYASK
ncbi:MAG: adenylyl-sulfate reductase subunit alpha [Candidatus Micrarchaeia archaeon]